MIQGKIIRVAGPVVDVQFTAGRLPALQEALTVTAYFKFKSVPSE